MLATSVSKVEQGGVSTEASYVLKRIPVGLWRAVKIRAAERGETMRSAIVTLLEDYARADKKKRGR